MLVCAGAEFQSRNTLCWKNNGQESPAEVSDSSKPFLQIYKKNATIVWKNLTRWRVRLVGAPPGTRTIADRGMKVEREMVH